MIKDRSTSTAKAVFHLNSLYKWCLTGTPLQNRVLELYSLIRFLRLDPHAYYFCKGKGCQCTSLFTNSAPVNVRIVGIRLCSTSATSIASFLTLLSAPDI